MLNAQFYNTQFYKQPLQFILVNLSCWRVWFIGLCGLVVSGCQTTEHTLDDVKLVTVIDEHVQIVADNDRYYFASTISEQCGSGRHFFRPFMVINGYQPDGSFQAADIKQTIDLPSLVIKDITGRHYFLADNNHEYRIDVMQCEHESFVY